MVEVLRTFVESGQTLTLRRRGEALDLLLGNVVLLSSAALGTEDAFGRLATRGFAATDEAPRIVIGGLGFGATLRAVLAVAPPRAQIVVTEKLQAVVDVARNEAASIVQGALDDERVTLVMGDIADVIARETELAALLLDVDNGPEWASFRSNARLYAPAALERARAAMRPGGIFAVWSGYPRDAFVPVLRAAGFRASIEPLREGNVVRARAYVGIAPEAR